MHVIFRFDSGPEIGMGHLMRCLTLASALEEVKVRLTFFGSAATIRAIRHYRPKADCHTIPSGLTLLQQAKQCSSILEKFAHKPDWLVVDHYQLTQTWERHMRGTVRHILTIDDLHRLHQCDILLDASLQIIPDIYAGKIPPYALALLGPRYALLRPGFKKAYVMRSTDNKIPRIFLCFGGSDPHDLTRFAAVALAGIKMKLDIVVGYSYAGKKALAALTRRHPDWTLHIDHPHPETLMAKADIAVGAGGTMTWERCAMGLPSVVISIASNQVESCKSLAASGIIDYLGDFRKVGAQNLRKAVSRLLEDQQAHTAMAKSARALVDGEGAKRVAAAMAEVQENAYGLRRMRRSDTATILAGRNSSRVRSCMLAQHVIQPDEHLNWMKKHLADPDTRYFVFLRGTKPIGLAGLAHFNQDSRSGDWDFYIWDRDAPKGAGTHMLAAFLDEILIRHRMASVTAEVLTANQKSLHIHGKLGFTEGRQAGNVTEFSLSRAAWRRHRKTLLATLENVAMLPS